MLASVAKTRTPREAWIAAALEALAAGGPNAVRVEALATRLKVTKGGFYWHFADRQALLDAALDAWEAAGTDEVIARVDAHPGDARAKVRELFALAPTAEFAVDLAVRDWSRRDAGVRERLRGIDGRRMAWLRSLFAAFAEDDADAEARTMLAYSLLIGAYFIAGERGRAVQRALDRLLA